MLVVEGLDSSIVCLLGNEFTQHTNRPPLPASRGGGPQYTHTLSLFFSLSFYQARSSRPMMGVGPRPFESLFGHVSQIALAKCGLYLNVCSVAECDVTGLYVVMPGSPLSGHVCPCRRSCHLVAHSPYFFGQVSCFISMAFRVTTVGHLLV